jgi:hypothetical protein
MGAQVVVNTTTRCDIANAIRVTSSDGSSFVGEAFKDIIKNYVRIENPLKVSLGL